MNKRIILFIFIIFLNKAYSANLEDEKWGILYDCSISKEEALDAYSVCRDILPLMTPEQVNESIRDVRIFIEKYDIAAVKAFLKKTGFIGEFFLTNILHAYGHVINFIETAWVDMQTKKVFVPEGSEMIVGAVPLSEYFEYMKNVKCVKIHTDKLYATCIDYLVVMIGTYLSIECHNAKRLDEVENRWIFWLEKVARRLDGNEVYGLYYNKYVKILRETFALWKGDFEKLKLCKRTSDYGDYNDKNKKK